jgi:hypothetical protein
MTIHVLRFFPTRIPNAGVVSSKYVPGVLSRDTTISVRCVVGILGSDLALKVRA